MKRNTGFGDLPAQFRSRKNCRIVILPVPYDKTSTWIKGADKGPQAIIEASANMELYDIETDSEVYRLGIFTDKPVICKTTPEKMVSLVEKRVDNHLAREKFVVVIGGEHSVSVGAVKAHAKKYKKISVLQLDAHSDLRNEYHGSKYNHACVMARTREICPIVQVGIRSMDVSESAAGGLDHKRVFFAEDIHKDNKSKIRRPYGGWIDKVLNRLTENVYITIDLDCFDPSIMPSTGTPEPGGLLWYDCLSLLKKVSSKKNVIGFDVVEMCPNKQNKAPDFLAAKLIYKLLSYINRR
jgi:agmatinase